MRTTSTVGTTATTTNTAATTGTTMRATGTKASITLVTKHMVDTPDMADTRDTVTVIMAIMWVSSGGCFGSCWFWVCR
ncbi:hypothetical protein, partial [Nesterenkonia alkaliphila]|uniref:hypothetical protein n=1 Tax=Nesterenkonia alkaliphila TaxID=1463631 RepID=UPI0022AB12EA